MSFFEKAAVALELLWAQHHVHLLPEPPGRREGVIAPPWFAGVAEGVRPSALRLLAVGDSMVAACGVPDQRVGLTPQLARRIADITGRPVSWRAVGRLGATMRRVRYRFLPAITRRLEGGGWGQAGEGAGEARRKPVDILVICAGSNDVMARRTVGEWRDDLSASLDLANPLARHVVVLSAGWLYLTPSLGAALRRRLGADIARQTAVSRAVCAAEGAAYVSFVDGDIDCPPGFWASDGFHPSLSGYNLMADTVIAGMQAQGVLQPAPREEEKRR